MRKNASAAARPRAAAAPEDKSFVTALQKGLDVLTCFNREAARLTLSEVARLAGSTPASARRSLHTLHALGYLDSDGKRFWPAPRALLVGHSYLVSRPLPQLAQPLLDALAERTRQSATFGTLLGDDALIIARSTARRSLSTGLAIGSRLPGYCSALGRTLLASLPPDEVRRRIELMPRKPLTERTVWRTREVIALVDRCREEGWTGSDGELELGVRSLAVPAFDREGRAVGAISMAVRAERMTMAEFREAMLPVLQKARDSLAQRLPREG
ncbi:IclR family transcriptional regulator domain-containing protein [Ramlibacter sp. Leaf400]|uniref:IclR family transcriptional regulator domain-containing protein n=1 Tax=Ramlibacter sp. Leaf400 TaxID=1736365 RepID=UPI0007008CEF|nr:IclR family transcriptional regulator C-terminal domain-containing protein [Ramlibacter sp. Leaf400]KQT13180.1 IclR family transcriptional regulator [Ramlibacter sp. Leaf400]